MVKVAEKVKTAQECGVSRRGRVVRPLWGKKECEMWRSRPPESIAAYARRTIRLTTPMGCAEGPYDPDITPWVHVIFQAYQDRRVEAIVFVKAAQIGGSLTSQIIIVWVIDCDPTNIINFMDTTKNAEYASTKRIQLMLDAQPSIAGKVDPPHKRKMLDISYDGGSLTLAGANSLSQLGNKSAPRVNRDEIGKWPDAIGDEAGALENSEQRVKGQYWSKLFDLSTPVMHGDPILKRWELSDKTKWFVPCPHCGCYQELVWEQVKYIKDVETGKGDSKVVRKGNNTWYECVGCEAKIFEKYKRWMLKFGQAVRAGEKIEIVNEKTEVKKAGEDGECALCFGSAGWEVGKRYDLWSIELPGGERVFCKRTGSPEFNPVVGLHISRIYSVFVSWGKMAEEWLQIGDDLSKRQAFINSSLAQAFKAPATEIDSEKLAEHITAAVKPQVVTEGYDVLICTADYHGPRIGVRYNVWAINPLNFAMDLIEYGEFGSLDDLGDRVRSPYKLAGGGEEAVVDFTFVDSGFQTAVVYDFCRKTAQCLPTKGFAGRAGKPYSLREIEDYEDTRGRKVKKPKRVDGAVFKLFLFDANVWKDYFHMMLNTTLEDGGYMVRFHGDTRGDLIDEMSSEKRIDKTDKRTQKVTTEWVKVKGKSNHYWDDAIMATVAAQWFVPQVVNRRLRALKEKTKLSDLQRRKRAARGR